MTLHFDRADIIAKYSSIPTHIKDLDGLIGSSMKNMTLYTDIRKEGFQESPGTQPHSRPALRHFDSSSTTSPCIFMKNFTREMKIKMIGFYADFDAL